jgi:hypothetical protein
VRFNAVYHFSFHANSQKEAEKAMKTLKEGFNAYGEDVRGVDFEPGFLTAQPEWPFVGGTEGPIDV